MTRKRFIRLLMARGYSRNSARDIADFAQREGWSYAEAFDKVRRLQPLIVEEIVPRILDAATKATETLARVLTAMGEAASAAVRALGEAMSRV